MKEFNLAVKILSSSSAPSEASYTDIYATDPVGMLNLAEVIWSILTRDDDLFEIAGYASIFKLSIYLCLILFLILLKCSKAFDEKLLFILTCGPLYPK